MLISILLIVLGFVFLIIGADILVDGSSGMAKKFHIPEIIIGLTIVSIGTSMPELFVSITSALNGHSDMAIGNVIGSNISNLLLVLGFSAILQSVAFKKETIRYEIPMCLAATTILLAFSNTGVGISRFEGIILLILFAFFILYTIFMAKKERNEEILLEIKTEKNKENSILKNIVLIIVGIIGLKLGGDFVVNNAVNVAEILGWSEKIISLTILAIGTSLPELVTSVTAAIKGDSDIAIGNIIGSNIFNIFLIIGVSSIIKPIMYNLAYNFDFTILMVATVVLALFPFIPPKNKMSRVNGIIYFLMYVGYMIFLFVN